MSVDGERGSERGVGWIIGVKRLVAASIKAEGLLRGEGPVLVSGQEKEYLPPSLLWSGKTRKLKELTAFWRPSK